MIKRPLVWILATYLVGAYLAWLKLSVLLIFLSLILSFLLILFFMFLSQKKEIYRRDRFLWCLPCFLLLGFLVMEGHLQRPAVYNAFDQEIRCELEGKVTSLVIKKNCTAVYLENVLIRLPDDKSYTCGHVIVYTSQQETVYRQTPDEAGSAENADYSEAAEKPGEVEKPENPDHEALLSGNMIMVRGTLQKFQEASNPGQFNEQFYYQMEDIDFKMNAKEITVTNSGYSYYRYLLDLAKKKLLLVYDSILEDREAGALIAMLLGEKYLLSEEIKDLYQQNGISHILAISGLHVSLIGMFIFRLLKKLRVPLIAATLITIFTIYSYGVLTNFSVSTNRAVVMMILLLLAAPFGKSYDMLSAMSLSALLILLQNPLQIFSAGFLLSYSAVFGITVILPGLKLVFPSEHLIVKGLLVSISAQIATTPVILWFYYQYPTYSVLNNLIILPFVTILTLTSILAGIAGAVFLPAGIFLIGGAGYILKFYEWICTIGSSLPGNLITVGQPDGYRIILYLILVAFYLWYIKIYPKKSMVVILASATLLILLPSRKEELSVTFLDVGQGDAIYMENNSTNYFIDGGSADVMDSGVYRLEPFLLSQGRGRIDFAVVTHSDNDHISGLMQLIERNRITLGAIILPDIPQKDPAYLKLVELAESRAIKIRYCIAGDIIKDKDLTLICLHPGADYQPSSINSYSMVWAVSYGEFDLLLTGDLQADGERLVINRLLNREPGSDTGQAVRDYEVLKVSHHGSRYSTEDDFLSLIDPEIAVISCGRNNYYGHPHPELLDRLQTDGCDIRITYETGAVTVRTDGREMLISNYKKETE